MASFASGVYSAGLADASVNQRPGSVGHTVNTELSRGYAELADGYMGLTRDSIRSPRRNVCALRTVSFSKTSICDIIEYYACPAFYWANPRQRARH